jgi:cell division protein FtsB
MSSDDFLRGAPAPEPWRPERARREDALGALRNDRRTPYLRRPWTEGRIGGRTFKSALALLGLVLVYLLLLGETGWIHQWRLQDRRSELFAEIQRLEAESTALDAEARRLAEDPHYRERIAREEWGFKRPDETVYHLRRLD